VPLPLGREMSTPGALEVLAEAGEDPLRYLAHHSSEDWGNLDEDDRWENEWALGNDWRVLSSYPVGEKTVWVITEANRSVTTILLPEEY
jgi:hypothetical protein